MGDIPQLLEHPFPTIEKEGALGSQVESCAQLRTWDPEGVQVARGAGAAGAALRAAFRYLRDKKDWAPEGRAGTPMVDVRRRQTATQVQEFLSQVSCLLSGGKLSATGPFRNVKEILVPQACQTLSPRAACLGLFGPR